MSLARALLANPALVLRHRNLFLLSHMRANTSLFGHLVGSHPQIEGYYEMHIGYYGWKSLWRQKLLHFAQHEPKPGARWMFDKVLHDGHHVAPEILRRPGSRAVFMLRAPEQSIRSLAALYAQRRPQAPEATPAGATRYYVERLRTLTQAAAALGPRFFYLDAESLVEDTEATLAALSDWLALDSPIPSEYGAFALTGRGGAGDPSDRLKSGRVQRGGGDYAAIALEPAELAEAREAYRRCREALAAGSARHVLAPPSPPPSSSDPTP